MLRQRYLLSTGKKHQTSTAAGALMLQSKKTNKQNIALSPSFSLLFPVVLNAMKSSCVIMLNAFIILQIKCICKCLVFVCIITKN